MFDNKKWCALICAACGVLWWTAAGGVSEGTELLLLRLHAVAAASTTAKKDKVNYVSTIMTCDGSETLAAHLYV
jgi:hypothetical protein